MVPDSIKIILQRCDEDCKILG